MTQYYSVYQAEFDDEDDTLVTVYGVPVRNFKWATEPPTEPGVYWVRVREEYEKEYETIIANVSVINGHVSLWFPVGGMECEDQYDAKFVTHWLGPIPPPAPPEAE